MRCDNCDSRYCGTVCHADDPRYAYVVGTGYVPLEVAHSALQQGRSVDWPQSPVWATLHAMGRHGWMPVRDRGAQREAG